jgi:hypothetical protein
MEVLLPAYPITNRPHGPKVVYGGMLSAYPITNKAAHVMDLRPMRPRTTQNTQHK